MASLLSRRGFGTLETEVGESMKDPHGEHDFGGPRNQCPFCFADLRTKLREAQEEARLFETLFEARCKLLADTKLWGLRVCEERDDRWTEAEAKDEVAEMLEAAAQELGVAQQDAAQQRALAERRKEAMQQVLDYWGSSSGVDVSCRRRLRRAVALTPAEAPMSLAEAEEIASPTYPAEALPSGQEGD